MTKREISPGERELIKIEMSVKFMYFLRDIGIKAARDQAIKQWMHFVYLISEMGG
jgi:hypothetical protein